MSAVCIMYSVTRTATCQIEHYYYILSHSLLCIILCIYTVFVIACTVGNVTFDVGASEACFEFVLDDEMKNTGHLRLKIVSNTERIVLDKDLEITLIIVVDAESRECIMTLYYRHAWSANWIRIYICMCSDWQGTIQYAACSWHSHHRLYLHNVVFMYMISLSLSSILHPSGDTCQLTSRAPLLPAGW